MSIMTPVRMMRDFVVDVIVSPFYALLYIYMVIWWVIPYYYYQFIIRPFELALGQNNVIVRLLAMVLVGWLICAWFSVWYPLESMWYRFF